MKDIDKIESLEKSVTELEKSLADIKVQLSELKFEGADKVDELDEDELDKVDELLVEVDEVLPAPESFVGCVCDNDVYVPNMPKCDDSYIYVADYADDTFKYMTVHGKIHECDYETMLDWMELSNKYYEREKELPSNQIQTYLMLKFKETLNHTLKRDIENSQTVMEHAEHTVRELSHEIGYLVDVHNMAENTDLSETAKFCIEYQKALK